MELGAQISFNSQWWSLISSTRIFVQSFCDCSFEDHEIADRISLSVHELLENAAKYSAEPDDPISCILYLSENKVYTRIQNIAKPEQIERLKQEFASTCEGDAMEVYINKMQQALNSENSQLGLARIRYEGAAGLKLEIDSKGQVTVEATFDVVPKLRGES